MKFRYIIIIFLLVLSMMIHLGKEHKNEIAKQISAINGQVVSIEQIGIFEKSPLTQWKNTYVYKFKYTKDGEDKLGYVRFAWGNDWIMDYKEDK